LEWIGIGHQSMAQGVQVNAYAAMAIVTAACFTVALIVSRGPWNLGHAVADRLERLAVWLHRVCTAGDYAVRAFQWKREQLRNEEQA
jgi:hypothetical protein